MDAHGAIDYVGATLGVSGLVMFNFVWNQAPSVGWNEPYEIGLLCASAVVFTCFIIWENRFAKDPILPLGIFQTRSFSALIPVVMLSFMSFAISLWYMLAWQQLVRSWTLLEIAIGWIPFGIGAIASTVLAAWLIPRVPAQWIVAIGAGAVAISNLLLATMPEQQSYWAQTFPAIAVGSFCPDLVYTAAQIIACNSVGRRHQGVAASLIGTLNLYGNSLGLGFAGTIETQVTLANATGHMHLVPGFRAALYFGVGIAVLATLLNLWMVRMPKDDREGWQDEADFTDTTILY
jgi:Na+/melibiose symporter-like transporter